MLAFLPSHSPDAAVAELERCAAFGHRGALIDVFDFDPGDPAWDRLWAAADATGLPLSFHIKGGSSARLSYQMGKWKSAAFATVLPLQLDEMLAIMVFSGALERHPGLTLVLAESGVGWLPYFLARMDLEWEQPRWSDRLCPEPFRQRAVPPPGDGDLRGGEAGVTVHSATSAPTRACGPRTTPTPTARSPSRRRAIEETLGLAARRRPPQDHRAQLRRRCTVSSMPTEPLGRHTGRRRFPGFDHVALPMQDAEAMIVFYRAPRTRGDGGPLTGPGAVRYPDGQLPPPRLWRRGFPPPGTGGDTAVWRPLPGVGRDRQRRSEACSNERGANHRRSGRATGRPSDDRVECLRPRPGRQSAGVHPLSGGPRRADMIGRMWRDHRPGALVCVPRRRGRHRWRRRALRASTWRSDARDEVLHGSAEVRPVYEQLTASVAAPDEASPDQPDRRVESGPGTAASSRCYWSVLRADPGTGLASPSRASTSTDSRRSTAGGASPTGWSRLTRWLPRR